MIVTAMPRAQLAPEVVLASPTKSRLVESGTTRERQAVSQPSQRTEKKWRRRRESNHLEPTFSTSTCPYLRDKRPEWFPPIPPSLCSLAASVAARSALVRR